MTTTAGVGGPVSNQVTNYQRTPPREVETRQPAREERAAPPPEPESRARGSRVNIVV